MVAGEVRTGVEEGHEVRLTPKAIGSEAFQRLGDLRRQRLLPHANLPVARRALVLVAHRHGERPPAVHGAVLHAAQRLVAVMVARVLRNAGPDVLDELEIGRLAELH